MRLTLPLLTFAALTGCRLDNQLNTSDKDGDVFDTGNPNPFETAEDSDPPPPEEECNGVDDDGDGEIDEGFPDADANGRVDCLDQTCPPLSLGDPGAIAVLEECSGTTSSTVEVDDPWNVRTQWTFRAPTEDASASNSYAQPVIGNLDDDNGDGDIDEDDTPEVVINAFGTQAYIVAIDGATGTEKWAYRGSLMTASVLIADVDSDGAPDVVGYSSSARAIALNGDGTLKWTSSRSPSSTSYPLISVADLEGDGIPEVIADDLVLDGRDGSVKFSLNASVSNPYRIAAVADIDLDGDQEIFMTGTAYDSDGSILWETGERGTYGFWPVIVQADEDDEAEVAFVGQNYSLWDSDGTEIYTVSYGTPAQPGPPCAGDFDGDGVTEIAWPAYQNFKMYELDGRPVWSVPMDDTSGLAGCSGFDVNGDGPLEVLYADQTTFTIFDGATGAENYVNNDHASGTVFEYPTVADIDHDGHAEILVASNYGATWGVLAAFEHDGDGWPASGSTWAVHDFAITNINPDGSVPPEPEPYWTKYNVYRARVAADDPSTPDLIVNITDVCVMDCTYGPVALSIQVANQGGLDVADGTPLAIYANDGSAERLVATYSLPAIPAGTELGGIEFELSPADVGVYGFLVRVDDDGTGNDDVGECDEENNEDAYTDVPC